MSAGLGVCTSSPFLLAESSHRGSAPSPTLPVTRFALSQAQCQQVTRVEVPTPVDRLTSDHGKNGERIALALRIVEADILS